MTYLGYCDYLQAKYGIGRADYMTKNFSPTRKCKRTEEGLYVHHKAEDIMVMLSKKEIAERCPFAWQKKENLVYCDLLEHLFLHVLICRYPSPVSPLKDQVGISGITCFLIPELNGAYAGRKPKQQWRQTCHERIINDKDAYLAVLEDFIPFAVSKKGVPAEAFFQGLNTPLGRKAGSADRELYEVLRGICSRATGDAA